MIDILPRVKDAEMNHILGVIERSALGVIYYNELPDADAVPFGKLVVADDGTDCNIYFKTGRNRVFKFTGVLV